MRRFATFICCILVPASGAAQIRPAADVLDVPLGEALVLDVPRAVERVSVGSPDIADAVVVSATEIVIHGRTPGTTTLIVWDVGGLRRQYRIVVSAEAALARMIAAFFPGEQIEVRAVDNVLAIFGRASDPLVRQRILDMAAATGAPVLDYLQSPGPRQILLEVRLAEVSSNALRELSSNLAVVTPYPTRWDGTGVLEAETLSDGLLRVLLLDASGTELSAIIRALRTNGSFRALAEPNLIAAEGVEASFLAGGEFPFPVAQRGADAGVVTIEWRPFGVRLDFLPTVTANGRIRLRVAPEVSSLDFASGLLVQGFAIPSLLTRRAQTEVELGEGQTFAIAGLLDRSTIESVTRIPLLGDIPIIGALFQSRLRRENDTELLVLVTPRFVEPGDTPPPLPGPPR